MSSMFSILGWLLGLLPIEAKGDLDNGFIIILIVGLSAIIAAPALTRLYRHCEQKRTSSMYSHCPLRTLLTRITFNVLDGLSVQ
jgi:hypothetical protein